MKKPLILGYGTLCYALFFVAFLYLIGFLANAVVPRSVDRGPEAALTTALLVDAGLVLLFAIQHTVMARRSFKRLWLRIVPGAIERSTYVLFTSLILLATFWLWRPIPVPIWRVTSPVGSAIVWGVFAAGWGVVLLTTFLVDHFALFGLRQVVSYAQGREHPEPPLKVSLLYRFIRHPLYLGFLTVFWVTPEMTAGRLLYAGLMTMYVLIGIPLEERELVRAHGLAYEQYRDEIPMLLPRLGKAFRSAADGQGPLS
jgi:protein-S-isoprenylcysteine O-methyltransferase Ste14